MHVSRACLSHAWPIAAYPASLADQNGHLHMSKLKTKPAGENDVHKMHVQGWEMLSISEEHVSLQGGVGLPSIDNLVCILQEHRKKKNLARSRQVYLHLCDNGLEAHTVLGNYLVPMLVECGSVPTAQQIFEKLAHQNEYAWTSLLHGYIEWGESHLALDSFQKMQDNQVHPSMHTFVALVKACESLRDMVSGQEMHTEVVKRGCERDPFVSNCLLCMYAKCGSVADAQGVFDQLPVREIISWTALMTAYVEFGLSNEALNCLEHIKMEGLSPDSIMFVCILKACGSLGALDRGQEIHAEIIIEGLERDSSVGNTLLDMYVKCGSLVEAQGLFDELPVRDLVSWTALMAGFAENGLGEEAVGCLEQMQSEGMFPDAIMYVCCLKACCSIRAIDKGLKLHGEIAQEGFQVDQIVGNTLVDMYAKFGLLAEAQAVFDQLPMRDVVSWTALIAGYAECDFCEDVQNCLKQMQLEGCSPNTATYICSLKACSRVETLNWGREMHTKFTKEGFERETFMGSALVDMYAKCGSFLEAHAVLNELPVQNVVSWSALIAGYAEYGASEVAFKCLEQMEQVGMSPSVVTLVSSLKACSSTGALESGYKIHAEIVKKGFERDLLCGNALIDMYAKCGSLSASRAVFNKLPSRDAISWTALMAGYAERGLGEEAMKCLGEMQLECVPMDIMLWNTIILCYAEQGESEKALLPYARMQEQGLPPNSITFVSILQACCKTAALETGHRIHAQIRVVKKLEATEDLLSTALIDMYGKCGSMADAQQVFDMMSTRDLVQWNALITGYARQGESELVFILFDKMREEGVQPDGVTFSSVLFVCSHAGLVDKGLTYYETMVKEYSITPTMKHYSCMVDLLGRIGQLNEAVVMLEKMPVQPDLVAWNTVLGACRKLGDVELGEQAFDSSMRLGEQDPTSFILMANIYADVPT